MARDLLIGFGAGAFSGAFGVGGGIVLIPLLVLLLHFTQKQAQATSLVVVSLGAAAGSVTYAVAGEVAWVPAGFILIGGLLGSLVGSSIVQRTSDHRLQIAFGLLLIAVAVRLLWPGTSAETGDIPATSILMAFAYVGIGLAMGVISALFGIGGGIILIPVVVTLFGFSQQLAAGTSLTAVAPIAILGAWRQSRSGATDWSAGLRFGIPAVPGGILGATVAVSVSGDVVRALFALILVAVGIRMVRTGIRARGA